MIGSQIQEVLLLASTDGVPATDTGGRVLPIIHTGQRLHMIPYVWNTITLQFEPQSVGAAGAGDASASNQVLEIAELTAIKNKLPSALSGDRLKVELPAGGGGLTDAELRATAVPVSGPLTDAQLRAASVPVSAAALPLPAGAATFAQQDLIIDGIDALLTELANKTEPADVQQVDLTDEDARVLGRVKVFDATGNVITVAKDSTLTDGSQVANVSDRDARLLGRVKLLDAGGAVIDPRDTSDRDARLLGRVKNLDSAGAVIDPALKGQLPATLGQKTMAAALPVSIASDQSAVPVSMAAAAVLFKGRASTFRTLGRAGTTGQKLLSLHNATGSPVKVTVNKVAVDLNQTVVKAVTVAPPIVRVWKVTVLPTNGTLLTKNKIGGTGASDAAVTVRGDASADGTGSGTTLTATLPVGTIITQEFAGRLITAAGYEVADRLEFLGDTTVELGPLEGLVVFLDYVLATQNPVTDMWIASIEWSEV